MRSFGTALLVIGLGMCVGCYSSGPAAADETEAAPGDADYVLQPDQMPQLIGGLEKLSDELHLRTRGTRCPRERVALRFIVETNGVPIGITQVEGDESNCSIHAIEALSAMRFIPGLKAGEAVRVRMQLPVTFMKRARGARDG